MTSHIGRLYSLALALLVFFVLWAGIAARPWASTGTDPRLTALVGPRAAAPARQRARHEDRERPLDRLPGATGPAQDHDRGGQATAGRPAAVTPTAAPPASAAIASPVVRIVNLPPLTITRTS